MTQQEASNFYALLIGIDCYLPNKLPDGMWYASLKGCVRDISRVEAFLKDDLGIASDQIIKLTASSGDATEPTEPPEQWPTYANIVAGFHRLIEMARPGAQVYIHYSGHGGRVPSLPQWREHKGEDGLDETLVPVDIGSVETPYVRDVELMFLLQTMVEKGLLVTVVLDSCHAGSATRSKRVIEPGAGGAVARGIASIDTTQRPAKSLVAPVEVLARTWRRAAAETTRNFETGSGWLLEPQGYVLLAACRAHEFAYEYPFDGGEKSGALSHWLVDSFKRLGPNVSYKVLHERILAKIHSQFAAQTPQLEGEGDRLVFGSREAATQAAIGVISVDQDNQRVLLNVGQAQGVGIGTQLAVYPPGAMLITQAEQRLALVEITELGGTTSWARIIEALSADAIEQGSLAVLLDTGRMRFCRAVRIAWQAEPSLRNGDETGLRAVEEALVARKSGFLRLVQNGEAADYTVSVNRRGEYVIGDGAGGEIPNMRPVLRSGDGSPALVVERLVHLARYRNVRELDNYDPSSPLKRKLLVEFAGAQSAYTPGELPEPQPFNEAGSIQTVKHDDWIFLRIKNSSSAVLNITVLDLQPDWGISQVYPSGAAYFEPLDAGRELLLPLHAHLPHDFTKGIDIIKVFATTEASNFRWLELPALERLSVADIASDDATRHLSSHAPASSEWTTSQVEAQVERS
ncbi:MAG: caspase family protein [Pyrinomonadaceae bacterium]